MIGSLFITRKTTFPYLVYYLQVPQDLYEQQKLHI